MGRLSPEERAKRKEFTRRYPQARNYEEAMRAERLIRKLGRTPTSGEILADGVASWLYRQFVGRLYRQRREDGTLTYPVPLLEGQEEEIEEVLDEGRLIMHTPHGLAVRYLVPVEEEYLYPAARLAESPTP